MKAVYHLHSGRQEPMCIVHSCTKSGPSPRMWTEGLNCCPGTDWWLLVRRRGRSCPISQLWSVLPTCIDYCSRRVADSYKSQDSRTTVARMTVISTDSGQFTAAALLYSRLLLTPWRSKTSRHQNAQSAIHGAALIWVTGKLRKLVILTYLVLTVVDKHATISIAPSNTMK